MQQFNKILVGVDLSQGDRYVVDELPPATAEAVERAMWLANLNSALITFVYSLELTANAQRLIEEEGGDNASVLPQAQEMLNRLVLEARARGIASDCEVRFGRSWLEIIQKVLREKYDLVVVGAQHPGMLQSFFMGNTELKLLRKCPCPVWVVRPQQGRSISTILVAHCLREVGDVAMEFGCTMARHYGAQLHVLHALDMVAMENLFPNSNLAETAANARFQAQRHIEEQLENHRLSSAAEVYVAESAPALALPEHIEKHDIKLLVMGTIARTGIPGIITGNTAEVLLPQLRCSVFAVKPPDFVSPVTVEAE